MEIFSLMVVSLWVISVLGAKSRVFFAIYFEKHVLFIISGLEMSREKTQIQGRRRGGGREGAKIARKVW